MMRFIGGPKGPFFNITFWHWNYKSMLYEANLNAFYRKYCKGRI